ncbi:MAG: hypothetical protein ACPL7K_06075, partial [Armatimonadota bacterium]
MVCEASVGRISARGNPSFFILRDEFHAYNEREPRIAVLCRPPVNLTGGSAVRVTGTLARLPNNELCIINPTVEGLFDARGRPVYWTPFPGFLAAGNWRVLPMPTGPIPPSDPSLPDDGLGIPGQVTAYAAEGVSRFDTVASLLAAAPPVLTRVELSAKPIVSMGEGYIVVGDDNSSAAVKVYTNAVVKPTDRIIRLTGEAHSENGRLVLYGGAGPEPFFDPQGFVGGMTTAKIGTVAYAGTLRDATSAGVQSARARSGGVSIMSISPPETSDGNWVYLTGLVVTAVERYYSYGISPNGWLYVYYVQGLDRTPGIRVLDNGLHWPTSLEPGHIVDVMAKVNTLDGERLLG